MLQMKKFFITNHQQEQSERLIDKLQARIVEYNERILGIETDGYGFMTKGYINSEEEAEKAENLIQKIENSIYNLRMNNGTWQDVLTIRQATEERNLLDEMLSMK
jgi:uncharacterized protein YutD